MHVIVAGCGRVGSQIADFLSLEGHDVVIIDRDPEAFKRLGPTFSGVTLEGVAFDNDVLTEAGVGEADAFAAVTNLDNTNLMTAEIVTRVHRVPRVVSRLYYPERELTFFKMGIDYICSTTLVSERIMDLLFKNDEVMVWQDRLDLGLQLVEFTIPERGRGRPAGDLDAGINSHLVALARGGRALDWDYDTPLMIGDHALVTMRREGWKAIARCVGDTVLDDPACRLAIIPTSPETEALTSGERTALDITIGGCSAVGAHLGMMLSMEGHRVTVIDEDPARFKRLPRDFKGTLVKGVIYDEETLLEAGIERADCFTAVTKQDNKNLMASEVCRHVFRVPRVVSRLFNPDKEMTYQALDINYVCGTTIMADLLLERLLVPRLRIVGSCFNNLYDVAEFTCPGRWDGRTVARVSARAGVAFAYVGRRSSGYMPEPNFVLRSGDRITAAGTPKKLQKLEEYLRKQTRE